VPARPDLDLTQILDHQRVAQVFAQPDRPEADHGMAPFARARAGEWRADRAAFRAQACHQIVGEERAIARHARHIRDFRPMRRRPVEPGQDAGEGSGEIGHRIGHNGEAAVSEARRIAVGVEDDAVALRREPREHAFQDGGAADPDARLVAAAHAPRQAAGEHEAEGLGRRRHD
jgi:hypothetical protein